MAPEEQRVRRSRTIRKPLGIGLGAMAGLFVLVFAWALTFNLSGAVIGKGQVQASASRIAVQHPIGGVVAEILANNGDKVESGAVLLKLDNASLSSQLATVESELFEILANEARLEAELNDQKRITPHPVLQEALKTRPEIRVLLDQQQRQLDDHYNSVGTQVSLLGQQASQAVDEARSVQAELEAKREQLAFSTKELDLATEYLNKGILTRTAVAQLQKDVITEKGNVSSLEAKVAQLQSKIAEQRLKINATPLDMKKLGADRLSLLRQQSKRMLETRNGLLFEMNKLYVRAPVSGMVFDSKVLGPRSVMEATKPIMYIVPDGKPNLIVVRVEAKDIDQVHVGQKAGIRFTTFNRRSTPIIDGRVTAISADAFVDEKKLVHYFVDVTLIDGELRKLGDVALLSGMPVEAFLETDSRSPASYVVKPLADFFSKSFRD